ncbi:UNVERIFIED_CONTAM: hypothetical protein FKN15_008250 [Acipenser sinensis]
MGAGGMYDKLGMINIQTGSDWVGGQSWYQESPVQNPHANGSLLSQSDSSHSNSYSSLPTMPVFTMANSLPIQSSHSFSCVIPGGPSVSSRTYEPPHFPSSHMGGVGGNASTVSSRTYEPPHFPSSHMGGVGGNASTERIMPSLLRLLCALTLVPAVTVAKPTQEKRDRVVHGRELSDHAHDDVKAGFQYDHEAFLGKEEAKTFDQLSPEESKERLGRIVDRIDSDQDGFVSQAELHSWIRRAQRRYIEENVGKHWQEYDLNKDDRISWEEYKNTTYGYYNDGKLDSGEVSKWILPGEVDHTETEAIHLIYESDQNKDEKLTKEEILNNWNMFVGSQATNYGEDLTKKHDEL